MRMKRLCLGIICCIALGLSACGSQMPQKTDNKAESVSDTQVQIQENISVEESHGKTQPEEITQEEKSDESAEEETKEGMVVLVKAGDNVITATLYDNEAASALWDMLPQTFPMMNLYGREMCYRMGNGALPDDTAEDIGYEIGDISYWPPAGSLVILYKQNGEVFEQVKIGHTDDDVSFFDGMEDTKITFEKAE